MDERYWQGLGNAYENEIFDSAASDLRGAIPRRLDEFRNRRRDAIDFGCGVGRYLGLLAPRFRRVTGVDFAETLVARARARAERDGLANVHVRRGDLARLRLDVEPASFGVCANVLISREAAVRAAILRSIKRYIAPGGAVLFVVPSLECALLSNRHLVEWNRRCGYSPAEALETGIPPSRRTARELLDGIIRIENVETKHFLREEGVWTLTHSGFECTDVDKVEYPWSTEFERPPRWMGEPLPWDWLFIARRV